MTTLLDVWSFAFSHNNRNISNTAVGSLLCPLENNKDFVYILRIKYLIKKIVKGNFFPPKGLTILTDNFFFFLIFSFLLYLTGQAAMVLCNLFFDMGIYQHISHFITDAVVLFDIKSNETKQYLNN